MRQTYELTVEEDPEAVVAVPLGGFKGAWALPSPACKKIHINT